MRTFWSDQCNKQQLLKITIYRINNLKKIKIHDNRLICHTHW